MKYTIILFVAGCAQVYWPSEKCTVEDVSGTQTHVCRCGVEHDTFDPKTGTITRMCDDVKLPFVTYTKKATVSP